MSRIYILMLTSPLQFERVKFEFGSLRNLQRGCGAAHVARHQRLADEAPGRDAARKAAEHVQLCRRREESRLDQIVIPDITCAIYMRLAFRRNAALFRIKSQIYSLLNRVCVCIYYL